MSAFVRPEFDEFDWETCDRFISLLTVKGDHDVDNMLRKIDQIGISTNRLFLKDKHFRSV